MSPVLELPRLDATDLVERAYAQIAGALWKQLSFEQKQQVIMNGVRDVGAGLEERALQDSTTNAELIEVEGVVYRRLGQASSVRCFGMWGAYRIAEPLYREVGVHNGRTIKPLEKAAGLVTKTMTPMLARTLGEMQANSTSREAVKQLRRLGLGSGERAYAADHVHELEVEIADQIVELEGAARAKETLPEGVASVSLGMDRRSVPMQEVRAADQPPKTERRARHKPYVRKQPADQDRIHTLAYVGTVSLVDEHGEAIRTTRHTMEADGDPRVFAERLHAEIADILVKRPGLPISIVQDGAKEFDVLPETLRRGSASNTQLYECTDFHHLIEYLDKVVATCEPAGDPRNMKTWYRDKLLQDERGILDIFAGLRRRARKLPKTTANKDARGALARALSYIRHRRHKMRYATLRQANLVIGSGTTESTCKLIGQRTNRSGTRWGVPGVRGTMSIRALVLSERWDLAWEHYARSKIAIVTPLRAVA